MPPPHVATRRRACFRFPREAAVALGPPRLLLSLVAIVALGVGASAASWSVSRTPALVPQPNP